MTARRLAARVAVAVAVMAAAAASAALLYTAFPDPTATSSQRLEMVATQPTTAKSDACAARFYSAMRMDACYALMSGLTAAKAKQLQPGKGAISRHCLAADDSFYVLPPPAPNTNNSTNARMNPILVFIHVNKAGGTTIKRDLIEVATTREKWDGASFGTSRGFKRLGRPWPRPAQQAARGGLGLGERWGGPNWSALPTAGMAGYTSKMPEFFRCGRGVAPPPIPPSLTITPQTPLPPFLEGPSQCPLRFVWGGNALGLCEHFPGRACAYFTVLRDPISRAASFYNYFCVRGEEHHKLWEPGWTKCDMDVATFMERHWRGGSLLERFSRAGLASSSLPSFSTTKATNDDDEEEEDCGVRAAVANLAHPCMRYLLLDRFEDGLRRLAAELDDASPSDAMRRHVLRVADALQKGGADENAQKAYDDATTTQLSNATTLARLRRVLRPDLAIYDAAVHGYDAQWTSKPLQAAWRECSSL